MYTSACNRSHLNWRRAYEYSFCRLRLGLRPDEVHSDGKRPGVVGKNYIHRHASETCEHLLQQSMAKTHNFSIGKRSIGPGDPPFVIAEIGINHEGSVAKAKHMVRDAYNAGAECVKFQSHIVSDEMTHAAKKVIPGHTKESIWEIISRCAFNEKQELELKKYVESLGMIYLCTPFSRAAADRLHKFGVLAYKIGSGECNNYPLVDHIASFGSPVLLSTGINDIASIRPAVKILEKRRVPYVIFHCTSLYPTPYDKVRLGALEELQRAFPRAVIGLSDHSLGPYTAFAAVALGASVIEKHFTSDKKWPGPDIAISLTPPELKGLIEGVNAIHQALGGNKKILTEETPTIDFAYSCVVAIQDIAPGEKFTMKNVWVKRPGTGEIKAKDLKKVLGEKAKTGIKADEQIRWKQIV